MWQKLSTQHSARSATSMCAGFTLIEISIVLVIIGLLVGGVLVGRDLIEASQVRAQISQIEQFKTAANTFKLKYNSIPGDISLADAAAFGLSSGFNCEGGNNGVRGNGIIDGCYYTTAADGEANLFWEQLGNSGLISGKFKHLVLWNGGSNSATDIYNYLPSSKIGGALSYMYVWGGGTSCGGIVANKKKNYFAIGIVTILRYGANGMESSVSITPAQAYIIDSKMDDGLPQSGKITAMGAFGNWSGGEWRGADSGVNPPYPCSPTTAAVAGSSTTCYDNGSSNGKPQQYSVGQNGGSNITCVISNEF